MIGHLRALMRNIFYAAVLLVALTACSPSATPTAEVTLQAALPTPTPEPTFTPSPPPPHIPQPSPTAMAAEPTPTPAPQPVALSGRILDQNTHQPIAGATVRVGTVTATTDAEGHYTMTGLLPGQYVLSVTRPDYDPGLSSIFTLMAGQEHSLDLALYAPDTSPYPKDPMLTNPLDPNGAPTAEDAERLARLQGLGGEVVDIRETKLRGEYLVNYKIGDEVRAAVAELNHEVWELTDDGGRTWRIIKVCGNLASSLPTQVAVATPQPRSLPLMAEVLVDELIVRECASEECAEVRTVQEGAQAEVIGCLADGAWCQVTLPGGGSGWCTGQSLRQLAVAVPVAEAVLPTATPEIAVSGKGRIAFISRGDYDSRNFEIYTINPDGSGLTRVTNNPGWDDAPAWSSDGQKIAFHSDRDDLENCGRSGSTTCNWEIYVMNADGGDVRRLTNQPARDREPTWSPDGRRIAFIRDGNIHVMNADGTDVSPLTYFRWPTTPSLAYQPAWSPDGQRIAFVGQHTTSDGGTEIYVINVDSSGLTRLTNSLGDDWWPAWSPDGQKIAFFSFRDAYGTTDPGNSEIYVMNSDGSSQTRITYNPTIDTNRPGADEDPTWSPDGRQIAFRSYRDGGIDIYVMNADGSGVTRLTFEGANYVPNWSRR
jgi:Tol biopolymer transport system component/protocatechuate 3,4-dioxygenase beta subunit